MKYKVALIVIIVVAALLRFGGLSHDLHEGKVYHPDTPKQVRAIQRFLDGRYYVHTGISDYDGYPYFNSHLVEVLCRAGEPIRVATLNLLGVPTVSRIPDVITLFWITLLFNATMATLLVWLVYRLVLEHYGIKAALTAAAFIALSPVDVTACHYANGDTTAAFFATLSLLFALRIAREGRWRDYLFAVIFAACGFAAKYHAGLAALPILIAHIARHPSPRTFFSRASWSRLLVCAAVGIATLFITIPTLIGHTSQVVQDIVFFFTHVSKGRRLPVEVRGTGAMGKFLFSMTRNGPILLYILGPIAAAASLLALVRLSLRDVRLLIIGSLPVVYFLVGVSFRPIAPPVYHTLMTPMVFILAAVFLTHPFNTKPFTRRLWTVASVVAILLSIGYLGRQALKETFFQWHMDTRRMAGRWVAENVPSTFLLNKGLYTFQSPTPPPPRPEGTVFVRSSIYPEPPPPSFHLLKNFALERDSLMMFRNPDITTHLGKSHWFKTPAAIPITQRWPSETGNQFIFDNGLTFLRDSKRLPVEANQPIVRRLVTEAALKDAFLTVRNGSMPNVVTVTFGGESHTFRLAPGASEAILIHNPRRSFPQERGLFFYRLSASTSSGSALVRLATRSDEIGMALFDAGRYTEAASWLDDAAISLRNPTLAVQALASRQLATTPPAAKPAISPGDIKAMASRIKQVSSANTLEDTYGIGPRYLDKLAFLSIPGESLIRKGFKKRSTLAIPLDDDDETDIALPELDPSKQQSISTTPLFLDAGFYTCSVRFTYAPLPEQNPVLTFVVALPDGTPLSRHKADLSTSPPYQKAERQFQVYIPGNVPAVKLMIKPDQVAGLTVERIDAAPDILATVQGWKTILELLDGAPAADAATQPMAFDLLVAKGNRAATTNDYPSALDFYMAAARARPETLLPASRIAAMTAFLQQSQHLASSLLAPYQARQSLSEVKINARFKNGLRLESALFRETEITPGGTLGLNFYWTLEQPAGDLKDLVVWVHFLDAQGKIIFQGDHDLLHDLSLNRSPLYTEPYFTEIPVPATVKPGEYGVRIGIYIPASREIIQMTDSPLPGRQTSLKLPQKIVVR
jgi:hypothetical protein